MYYIKNINTQVKNKHIKIAQCAGQLKDKAVNKKRSLSLLVKATGWRCHFVMTWLTSSLYVEENRKREEYCFRCHREIVVSYRAVL